MNDTEFIRRMQALDFDNLEENEMLDCFVYLNMPELEASTIRRFSKDLEKLVLWCQAVVSYHILIHPFTLRNNKGNIIYQYFNWTKTENFNSLLSK